MNFKWHNEVHNQQFCKESFTILRRAERSINYFPHHFYTQLKFKIKKFHKFITLQLT